MAAAEEDGEVPEGEDRGVPAVGAAPAAVLAAGADPAVAVREVPGDAAIFSALKSILKFAALTRPRV